MGMLQISSHIKIAIVLHAFCIIYGKYQDLTMMVKFTDIDYHVITDGANYISQGQSPFQRHTYRYTPLLALLLLPNTVYMDFGKILFSALNVVTGYLIYRFVKNIYKVGENNAINAAMLWLYNPLPLLISTRGNAESVMSVLVILSLYLIYGEKISLSAVVYGLSVHFKIYPIIYAPSFFFALTSFKNKRSFLGILSILIPNKNQILFFFLSGITFLIPTLVSYYFYGMQYIEEAFLYHIVRKDIRHNFSPFFYLLYLMETVEGNYHLLVSLVTFLPQFFILIYLSVQYGTYEFLPLCLFSQTFLFVALNKVCTSQYFLWYLCLLPLVIVKTNITVQKGLFLTIIWLLGQGAWLLPAYMLEFQGLNVYIYIWIAGLLFFLFNIAILSTIMRNYQVGTQSVKKCR